MRFEKWQALGNDYLIVTEPLDPEAVQAICHRHLGVGADGVLLVERTDEPGFTARLRIFNPDGSEAELSGNGAREALMWLHHNGWARGDEFSIRTIAGEIRAHVLDDRSCRVDMGRARIVEEAGEIHGYGYVALEVGNPQCSIRIADWAELQALDLPAVGRPIEVDERWPNRTNVSFWTPLSPDRIRARIFERGVGETMSSGTGATGAAIAHVLRGGDSPVTVELDGGELIVDVAEDLHVDLTGWAVPVFAGEWPAPAPGGNG
jgi:diaminopimelate epimerase